MKITNKYYLIDNDLRSIVIVESASTIDIVSISRYRSPSSHAHAKLVNKGNRLVDSDCSLIRDPVYGTNSQSKQLLFTAKY